MSEITEAILKNRIRMAVEEHGFVEGMHDGGAPGWTLDAMVDAIYTTGKFADFVGVVGKATTVERERAAGVARRLGHAQTAQVIRNGGSDV